MSPPGNREEPLIRRLARSKAMQGSREASMSPTRAGARSTSQPPVKNQQMGSYYTTENGSIVQYIPYSFVYPGNANISNSLPSLPGVQTGNADGTLRRQPIPTFPSTGLTGLPPGHSHRRLSKMSNLLWTSSVSQPDLTMTTTSTTMSPSTSQPTSRASSPVPPSISARGTPGQGPSPYISPLGSGSLFYQDLSCLSQALNQLGVAQNYVFPGAYQQMLPEHMSSSQQSLHDLNGNDANNLYIAQQQVNDSARAPVLQSIHEGTPALQPQHEGYHAGGGSLPVALAQGDPSAWYCQYVSLPPGVSTEPRADGVARPHEPRGQSSSPQRLVNLSPQRASTSKPCAVITPHLVSGPRKPHEPVIGGNEAQAPRDYSPLESTSSQVGVSSSALAQNFGDFNLYGSRPEIQRSDHTLPLQINIKAHTPEGTPVIGTPDSSCPDTSFALSASSTPSKMSVGTSCSDLTALDAGPPFILETCQICNVFHGTGSMALESQHPNTPYFKFRPCSYGLQVVGRGGAVHLQDGNRCRFPSCETANQLDNAPKYEGDYKLQSGTQLATKGSTAIDQLKSRDPEAGSPFRVSSPRGSTPSLTPLESVSRPYSPLSVSGALAASASGAGQGSIDNRIEQAMDLVKSHLMSAVRSEVEELREKIAKLEDTVQVLSRENDTLRNHVTPEVLNQLPNPAQRGLLGPQHLNSLPPPEPAHPALQPPQH